MSRASDTNYAWEQHHALLYAGKADEIVAELEMQFRISFSSVPHSDVWYRSYESFGIDEARELKLSAQAKPITLAHYTFILSVNDMTRESQNALLKLFEDPPTSARFILIVPNDRMLIDTLRSRLSVVNRSAITSESAAPKSIAEAFGHIARITKDKDNAAIEEMIEQYERAVILKRENLKKMGKDILLVRSFTSRKGASAKMLLEHLALAHEEANRT